MVTKFDGQILATKFGFVPDCSTSRAREHFRISYDWKLILTSFVWVNPEKTLSSRSLYFIMSYRKISDISHTLVGNKIIDHSDVVGASPVGAAPTTSSFSTWLQYIEQRQLQAETRNIYVLGFGVAYIRDFTFYFITNYIECSTVSSCPPPLLGQYNAVYLPVWEIPCGDKTVVWSSYLHNGISYTGKTTSLYWISPWVVNCMKHWLGFGELNQAKKKLSFVSPAFGYHCHISSHLI